MKKSYKLKERLKLALEDIKILKDNWDSYGAISPSKDTLYLVEKLLKKIPESKQPEVAPLNDGSIGLYWDLKLETYTLVVNSKVDKIIFNVENDQEVISINVNDYIDSINFMLNKLN